MTTSSPFSYDGLYSQQSVPVVRGESRHARYDFAVAYPDPDTLPLEGLADSLRVALEREGRDLAIYPVPAGLPSLREWVVEKLARDRNMSVTVDDVVLTSGSGEAISMLIAALTDPGDVLLTEEYVYLGTLRTMRRFGADVRSVKCDDEGIIPEELESILAAVAAEGKKVKFLYTIPSFQNPLGWTMSLDRRVKTLEITQKYGVPVLEDDCYVDLRFEGEEVTSMHSLDDSGRVLYVGSFSKIVAPGVRLGYMVAPQEVIQRAMSFKGGGGVNQFAALAVQEYAKGNMDAHIDDQNQSLRVKRDAMLASLGENFGDAAQWSKPQGGLYVWLELPEDVDLAGLQETSFNEGVGYYNGTMFSPEGRGANCARLCFGHPTADTVAEGVAELARIFERHGALKG
ncbi:MAG: PLP-dependent aminotransferase family protein [Chloroflexota bacterium]|nr:PLP-dependent aminotransferase family protein [Chloroflexota bacterium]